MKVSLVVPCFNEAGNIAPLVAQIDAMAADLHASAGHDVEVILVDDGSRDDTGSLLKAQAARDPRYKAVLFRR
ncbi:MAG TPA: glycosyltransferase, partial [Myxococcota bacterium]